MIAQCQIVRVKCYNTRTITVILWHNKCRSEEYATGVIEGYNSFTLQAITSQTTKVWGTIP